MSETLYMRISTEREGVTSAFRHADIAHATI